MAETVSCKKCSHARRDWRHFPFSLGSPFAWKCDRLILAEEKIFDPITGITETRPARNQSCMTARSKYGDCGPTGNLWEPKHKRDFLTYLKRI